MIRTLHSPIDNTHIPADAIPTHCPPRVNQRSAHDRMTVVSHFGHVAHEEVLNNNGAALADKFRVPSLSDGFRREDHHFVQTDGENDRVCGDDENHNRVDVVHEL
uniref:Uncharacterized protein n=1 Tax=Cacopsylla melanoneura TaxID=428564 RepID=A0A8D8W2D4_9HEMI